MLAKEEIFQTNHLYCPTGLKSLFLKVIFMLLLLS
jgi:hypothetical protein